MIKRKYLLNQTFFSTLINNEPIQVIDGGARGSVFAPFDKINPSALQLIRFDADPNAKIIGQNDIIIKKALWDKDEPITLHVAKEPSTSSVFPPNESLLEQFPARIGYEARKTTHTIDIDGTSIDSLVDNDIISSPDFIKLDIHGAEYEALKGAMNSLQSSVVAVLVETWMLPVHTGQKTHAKVASLLNDLGFYLFNMKTLYRWYRKNNQTNIYTHPQTICSDNLYIKTDISQLNSIQKNKLIGILNLFDQNDFARELVLQSSFPQDIEEKINEYFKESFPMQMYFTKKLRKVLRLLIESV